ncbi:acyl dehydratase [Branchiibius hedensis]|uniref:Acyl dehydratase n=1 Tax=Branchiibius hedensis TaxID=672460 RepID=A0A2Y9BT97_9MICO|nr:MaoC family dehydratase [Branchiibius hedensis]PWJ24856.1 acyl dehydratase [Branchiibius hedensis]SSA33672.1 Acyl dehydratase [Branchiibius hedensis]
MTVPPTVLNLNDLRDQVGLTLGPGPWHTVEQDRVNLFAEATGDHQWIHVDPERAAESSFGGTIAHGYLTLSMLPAMQAELRTFDGISMAVNYGLDKVRFPRPVPVGSKVRLTLTVVAVDDRADGEKVLHTDAAIELDSSKHPGCVARTLTLLRP